MLTKTLVAASTLLTLASAHFNLQYPATIGFDDDKESSGPCGGFNISDRKTVTNFPIDSTPIALKSGHSSFVFEFRAALLNNTSNLVNIQQDVQVDGLGPYCSLSAMVPEAWVGQDGVIQVIGKAEDGVLYQCAAVHFTAGSFSGSRPGDCTNKTQGAYTSASATTNSSDTTNTTSGATSATTKPNDGPKNVAGMGVAVIAAVGAVAALLV